MTRDQCSTKDAPILVIGKNGQLARALSSILKCENALFLGRDALDLNCHVHGLPACRGIILAAAYTDVDGAESNFDYAKQVNGKAVGQIADICAKRSIPLVFLSTDYVFDGTTNRPWQPNDKTDPLNAYGKSKLLGEKAILSSGAEAAILRTSWVFDGLGKNFLTTMLDLSKTRSQLTVVSDQVGRPTYAGHLALACIKTLETLILNPSKSGVYHVTNSGEPISWADFSRAIFRVSEIDIKIVDILSEHYPRPAPRPANSVLDIRAFEATFGYKLPSWQKGLDAALRERQVMS